MSAIEQATERQNAASDPARSTWVSANAGSGKTRVLTDRVARLLLAGVDPANILCLTFTKAAAAEMQSRLFERLGKWTMLPDAELAADLAKIGEATDAGTLREARVLFARALETPGGLKIQTIHAFCASLLRRFPVEAGVAPQFRSLEGRDATLLRAEVLEQVVLGDETGHFATLAHQITDEEALDRIANDIVKNYDAIMRFDRDVMAQAQGITGRETNEEINEAALAEIDIEVYARILQATRAHTKSANMNDRAAALFDAAQNRDTKQLFKMLENAVFTTTGISSEATFPGKAVANREPDVAEAAARIKEVIAEARDKRRSLAALNRAEALHHFTASFVPAYQARKDALGVLDFDDQIDRANALLGQSDVANWVRFRIDSGIDHILVDESQDTSPLQWQIVKTLESEFTDGQGKDRAPRTLFVVGDPKQSIFGFQGADPAEFTRMQQHFKQRQLEIQQNLENVELSHSFRSAGPILELVDLVFAQEGMGGLEAGATHRYFDERPGRVDLWDVIPKPETVEHTDWHIPQYDAVDSEPRDQLARKIAEFTSKALADGQMIPDRETGWRPLEPKDVLILLRQRGAMLPKLVEELKRCGVPVAGADRLILGDALAVRDVLSLLAFIDNEDDDLALAEALRSPLFGLSEDDLFKLAQPRKGTLWQALRDSSHEAAIETIHKVRKHTDFWRPYEVIEFILTTQGGRQALVARLGRQCEDALDALLAEALSFERSRTPTLARFLHWMQTGEVEVKREADVTANEVRIMTVHGAKGLEAPLVIIPDMGVKKTNIPLVLSDGDRALWTGTAKDGQPNYIRKLSQNFSDTEEKEFERLLYVALTRAESWMVMCGAGDMKKAHWYSRVEAVFDGLESINGIVETADEKGRRWQTENWTNETRNSVKTSLPKADFPQDLHSTPSKAQRSKPLSPSQLAKPHALPGEDNDDPARAMARGSLLHHLLEILPNCDASERQVIAERVTKDDPEGQELIATALDLIGNEDFAEIFAEDTLSEVPVAAQIDALGAPINGVIDRLVIGEQEIHAIDFKSNRNVPSEPQDIPMGILAQLAAYHDALAQIWPDRKITTSILWTQTATLMPVPHIHVNGLLQKLATS